VPVADDGQLIVARNAPGAYHFGVEFAVTEVGELQPFVLMPKLTVPPVRRGHVVSVLPVSVMFEPDTVTFVPVEADL